MDDFLDRLAPPAAAKADSPGARPSRLFTVPDDVKHLDSAQLGELEHEFRRWAEDSPRLDVRRSRRRVLLAFLLIRHTGARLGEVIGLDARADLDLEHRVVRLGGDGGGIRREVQLPEPLARELAEALADPGLTAGPAKGADLLHLEPGHLRRKFYERAEALGLPHEQGSPTVIRRSRAIELMRDNVPLPLVQRLLGHSTPSLAAGYLDLKPDEADRAVRHYVDRETRRRTSARNSFFGRITDMVSGDIQCLVELGSVGGHKVAVMITNESRERMGLKVGGLATVEIKAPWIVVVRPDEQGRSPESSARNRYLGVVERVNRGSLTTEIVSRLSDNTEICALITEESRRRLNLTPGDQVWLMFNAYAGILNVD
ncbi:MAG: TOBE domain-containing protein [Desulfovibrionaceae bacterium]